MQSRKQYSIHFDAGENQRAGSVFIDPDVVTAY